MLRIYLVTTCDHGLLADETREENKETVLYSGFPYMSLEQAMADCQKDCDLDHETCEIDKRVLEWKEETAEGYDRDDPEACLFFAREWRAEDPEMPSTYLIREYFR